MHMHMRLAALTSVLVLAAGCDSRELREAVDDGGSPDADTSADAGLIDGALIDAAVDASLDAGLDASLDAGDDGCATAPTGDWTGTARTHQEGSGSDEDVAATVTWTLAGTEACVDHYLPSGTVEYELSSGESETATWPIASTDGALVIDRSVAPATYLMTGETEGSSWASSSGSFEGAVIDGNVEAPFVVTPMTREWHLRPVGAEFPAPDGCVEPATEQWTFHGEVTEHADTYATVTWIRTSTDGCVDQFAPSGIASVEESFETTCGTVVQSPSSAPIEPGDGTLQVDRSTNPPTFQVFGFSEWEGTRTCTHPDGTVETSPGLLGDRWANSTGAYDGDRWSGGAELVHGRYTWRFER